MIKEFDSTFFNYQNLVTSLKTAVMGKNTSFALGDYFESFVAGRIAIGRYKNASEVVRAGLRLLEEEENKIVALKTAIQEGVDSGIDKNFNAKKHLQKLKASKKQNG